LQLCKKILTDMNREDLHPTIEDSDEDDSDKRIFKVGEIEVGSSGPGALNPGHAALIIASLVAAEWTKFEVSLPLFLDDAITASDWKQIADCSKGLHIWAEGLGMQTWMLSNALREDKTGAHVTKSTTVIHANDSAQDLMRTNEHFDVEISTEGE
jgi:hypothetical protein